MVQYACGHAVFSESLVVGDGLEAEDCAILAGPRATSK